MQGDGLSFQVNPDAGGESSALAWASMGGREGQLDPSVAMSRGEEGGYRDTQSAGGSSIGSGQDRHRSTRRNDDGDIV